MTEATIQEMQASARREYSTPQFVQFGAVSDLTASGSAGSKEGSNGIPPQKP